MKKVIFSCLATASLLSNEINYLDNLSVDVRAVYINYDYDKGFSDAEAFATSLKIKYEKEIVEGLTGGIAFGRFELETPLISSDDYFALSNSFEGVHVDIKEIDNYNFRLGFISKMAGAWDSAYDGSAFESMTKQAWAHRGDTGSESYYNLVDDFGVDNAGMGYVALSLNKKV